MKIYCTRDQSDTAIYDKLIGTDLWVKIQCHKSYGLLRGTHWAQIVDKFPEPAADGSPMYIAHTINDTFMDPTTGRLDTAVYKYSHDFITDRKRSIEFINTHWVTIVRPVTYLTTKELFNQE